MVKMLFLIVDTISEIVEILNVSLTLVDMTQESFLSKPLIAARFNV